jgi:hypothetical protein
MDPWLKSLNGVPVKGLPNYKAAGPDVDGQFSDWIRIDDDSVAGSVVTTAVFFDDAGSADVPEAVGALIAKIKSDPLEKTACVSDSSWDAPLAKRAAAATFPERRKERFEKACAVIKKVFGESEEYDAAIKLARKVLDEERAAVLLEQ